MGRKKSKFMKVLDIADGSAFIPDGKRKEKKEQTIASRVVDDKKPKKEFKKAEATKEILNRDTIKKRIKKKVRRGYLIGLGVMILGMFIGGITEGVGMILFVLGVVGMIVWKFINTRFWPKFAGDTGSCYECGMEIDLVDRWKCSSCNDLTRRHVAEGCPECKSVPFGIACPSCETTLALHPNPALS